MAQGKEAYGAVLFSSVQAALKAEKAMKQAGMTVKLIPTPRQLSSDCGTALRFPWSDVEEIRSVLEASGLSFTGIYPL